jgi:hypothetical protein
MLASNYEHCTDKFDFVFHPVVYKTLNYDTAVWHNI